MVKKLQTDIEDTERELVQNLEREYPELQELEIERKSAGIKWEVVDDDLREVSRNKFFTDVVTVALLKGHTIKLYDSEGHKYYRWAVANDLPFHRRVFDGFTIMYLHPWEKVEDGATNSEG